MLGSVDPGLLLPGDFPSSWGDMPIGSRKRSGSTHHVHGHPGERLGLAEGGIFFPQEVFKLSLKIGVPNTTNKVHERFQEERWS